MKKVTAHCMFLLVFSLFQFTRTSQEKEVFSTESRGNISRNATIDSVLKQNEPSNHNLVTDDTQKNIKQSLKTFQERLNTLRIYLKDLDIQINSEFNHHSLLKSIIDADKSLFELKQIKVQKLPHLTKAKIEKLTQSFENIKTTLFLLIQNHQLQSFPTLGNNTDINILKSLVESLNADLNGMNSKNVTSTDKIKFLTSTKTEKISILKEKIGQHNLPEELQTKIEKVEQEYDKFMNRYKANLGNYVSENQTTLSESEIRNHTKLIREWITALENDLNYYETHYNESQTTWMDFKISIQIDKIIHEIDEIGTQDVPEELKIRVKALQDRFITLKIDIIPKFKHQNKTSEDQPEPGSKEYIKNLWINVDSFESEFRKILSEQLSSQLNSSSLPVAISQIDYILYKLRLIEIENIPENLQKRVETLQKLLESFKTEAASIINKSQQYISSRITRLSHDLEEYKNLAQHKDDLLTLTQLQINSGEILLALKELGLLDRLSRSLKHKIEVLKENVKNFQEILALKIKQISQNQEKYIEQSVIEMGRRIDFIKDSLRHRMDINTLTYSSIMCDDILSNLQKLETDEHLSNKLKEKTEKLKNHLNSLKEVIELMIERDIQNSNQINHEMELEINKTIKKVKIHIKTLDKELAHLLQLIDTKPSLLKLFDMYSQVETILTELKQLVHIQSFPVDLKMKILSLKETANKVKNDIKLKLESKLQFKNGPNHSQNAGKEKMYDIIKQIIALEDNWELLKNQVHSKEDILTLTQASLETDKILYHLHQLERKNNIPDILKIKILKFAQNVKSFKAELKLLLEAAVQHINEKTLIASGKYKSQSKIYESIIALRDELERYKNQADSEQDVSTLTKISAHLNEILSELQQLASIDNASTVMNNTIQNLINKVTDFQDNINFIFKQMLLNRTEEREDDENWQKINETIIHLENSFENVTKSVKLKNDILTLTQCNLQLDEIIFASQKLRKQTLPEFFKNKIIILEQRQINFKIKVQRLLQRKLLQLIIGQNTFANKTDYLNNMKSIEGTIDSLEHSLDYLKDHLSSMIDLLSLAQTKIKTEEILNELKQLCKVRSLPDILKNKMVELDENTQKFITGLTLLIEKKAEKELKDNKLPESSNEQYIEIGNNITNLDNDLQYLKEIINTDQDIFTLIKTDIDTNKILDYLQLLKEKDNFPVVLQPKIDSLEQDCNNFKLDLQLTIEQIIQKLNDSLTNANADIYKNFEESITTLENSLDKLKSLMVSNQDTLTLTQAGIEAYSILDVLQHLKIVGNYSTNLQNQIATLEANIHQFQDHLRSLIKRAYQSSSENQTNDLINEKKLKFIYRLLINLENEFESMTKKSNLNEDLLLLTQTSTKADEMLYKLQRIDFDDSIPDWLQNRIIVLEQNLNNFKSELSAIIETALHRLVNSSSSDASMNNIVQTINTLINTFGNLKNLTNYTQDLVTEIHISDQVEEILQELEKIQQIQGIPFALKTAIFKFEQSVFNFKNYIDTLVNVTFHHTNNTEHNQLNIEDLQTVDNNITYIENSLQYLNDFIYTKQDLLSLTNTNIEIDNELNCLHQLMTVTSFPETLRNKIFTMVKTAESFKSLIQQKILNMVKQLSNTRNPKESVSQNLDKVEESINSLDIVLEKLNTVMSSTHEILPLTQSHNQADTLLQELLQLSTVNTFPDDIKNRIQDMKHKVISFKHGILLLIATIISKHHMENTFNSEKDNEIIFSLERTLENLEYQISRKQDLVTLTYINIEADKILYKLQQLEKYGRISTDTKSRVIQLSENVKAFKESFKELFEHAKNNLMVDVKHPTSEANPYENSTNVKNNLPSLDIYLENLRNLIDSKADLLILTQPNTEIEDIFQQLNGFEKFENLTPKQKNDIVYLKSRINDLIHNSKSLLENENIGVDQDKIQRNLQQIYDNLSYLEKFIEHQKYLVNSDEDILLLAKPYLKTDDILDYLKELQRKNNLPNVAKEKISILEQEITKFKSKVRQNIERIIKNIASNNTKHFDDEDTQEKVQGIVHFLETYIEHLENLVDVKQDSRTLKQVVNRLEGILKSFKYLLGVEWLPLTIKTKIGIIEQNLKNLEEHVKKLLRLNLDVKDAGDVDEVNVEQRISSLEAAVEWLQDLVNYGQNTEVDIYVNNISSELEQHIENMSRLSYPLQMKISNLYDRVNYLKKYMRLMNNSHETETVVNHVNNLTDITNIHNIEENIKKLENELNTLTYQLRFPQNDSVLMNISFRMDQILHRLEGFENEHIPYRLQNEVVRLEQLVHDSMLKIKQSLNKQLTTFELPQDYESKEIEPDINIVE